MYKAEDLLTVPEAAELLKVPQSWLFDRTRKDAIPLVRLGKYIRLPRAALLRWIERGCPAEWKEAEVKGDAR
jgi:excisionase family DNA binding protein